MLKSGRALVPCIMAAAAAASSQAKWCSEGDLAVRVVLQTNAARGCCIALLPLACTCIQLARAGASTWRWLKCRRPKRGSKGAAQLPSWIYLLLL